MLIHVNHPSAVSGHLHLRAGFGAFFLKNTANLRIFILVFDLPSAIGQGHIGLNLNWLQFKFSADDLESQVTCRLGDSLRASS
jgi:hypothetical protein